MPEVMTSHIKTEPNLDARHTPPSPATEEQLRTTDSPYRSLLGQLAERRELARQWKAFPKTEDDDGSSLNEATMRMQMQLEQNTPPQPVSEVKNPPPEKPCIMNDSALPEVVNSALGNSSFGRQTTTQPSFITPTSNGNFNGTYTSMLADIGNTPADTSSYNSETTSDRYTNLQNDVQQSSVHATNRIAPPNTTAWPTNTINLHDIPLPPETKREDSANERYIGGGVSENQITTNPTNIKTQTFSNEYSSNGSFNNTQRNSNENYTNTTSQSHQQSLRTGPTQKLRNLVPLNPDFLDTLNQLESRDPAMFQNFTETRLYDGNGRTLNTEKILQSKIEDASPDTNDNVYLDVESVEEDEIRNRYPSMVHHLNLDSNFKPISMSDCPNVNGKKVTAEGTFFPPKSTQENSKKTSRSASPAVVNPTPLVGQHMGMSTSATRDSYKSTPAQSHSFKWSEGSSAFVRMKPCKDELCTHTNGLLESVDVETTNPNRARDVLEEYRRMQDQRWRSSQAVAPMVRKPDERPAETISRPTETDTTNLQSEPDLSTPLVIADISYHDIRSQDENSYENQDITYGITYLLCL